MRTAQTIIFTVVLLVGFLGVSADADESWKDHPPWLGSWHATPQVSRILGLDQKGPNPTEKLQIEFFVSKDAAIAVAGQQMIERVESFFSKRLGGKHQLVAAGQWNDKEFSPESACFVTQIEGAKFLWFGDPSVSLSGAEVSYIRGVNPEHDLLVLDSSMPSLMKQRLRRTKQTEGFFQVAGYQRKIHEVEE